MSDYYAQSGEDIFLSTFFDPDYKGTCIDIGAADGISASNTYYFEKNGWQTYCVEPDPEWLPALRRNRKHVYQFAISDKNGEATFHKYYLNGKNMGAISSLEVDERLVKAHEHFNLKTIPIKVKTMTLDNFIAMLGINKIDFISIDTEGTELKVLKGFTIEDWFPSVLVIENNFYDSNLRDYLSDYGYMLINRTGVNDFYVLQT